MPNSINFKKVIVRVWLFLQNDQVFIQSTESQAMLSVQLWGENRKQVNWKKPGLWESGKMQYTESEVEDSSRSIARNVVSDDLSTLRGYARPGVYLEMPASRWDQGSPRITSYLQTTEICFHGCFGRWTQWHCAPLESLSSPATAPNFQEFPSLGLAILVHHPPGNPMPTI